MEAVGRTSLQQMILECESAAALHYRSIENVQPPNKSCPLSLPRALASHELEPMTRHPSPFELTQPPTAAMSALLSSC